MAYILKPSSSLLLNALVVSGPASDGPNLQLMAHVGNNGASGDNEVFLKSLGGLPFTAPARATWDPRYSPPLGQFHSMFQVRLEVRAATSVCRASAGTMDWLEAPVELFSRIETVQLSASVVRTTKQRHASWESAYVHLEYESGYTEDLLLDALPRAFSPQMFRQAAGEPAVDFVPTRIEQFAELAPENLVGFTVVGLIKFTANMPPAAPETVGVDDCQVCVSIFTDATGPQSPTPASYIRSTQSTSSTTIRSAQRQVHKRPPSS
jgi:hypothetical protein